MKKSELSLFNKIYSLHKPLLRNFSEKNPKRIIIGIAGVPGSGKTLLARHLARRFKAIRINNDEIRKIIKVIRGFYGDEEPSDLQKVLESYLSFLLSKISKKSPNKMMVLDSGIERKYERVRKWSRQNKYSFFVIKIAISKKQLVKNLHSRKKAARRYLPYMKKWFADYHAFSGRKVENAVFKNNGEIRTLRSFVNKLELN